MQIIHSSLCVLDGVGAEIYRPTVGVIEQVKVQRGGEDRAIRAEGNTETDLEVCKEAAELLYQECFEQSSSVAARQSGSLVVWQERAGRRSLQERQ